LLADRPQEPDPDAFVEGGDYSRFYEGLTATQSFEMRKAEMLLDDTNRAGRKAIAMLAIQSMFNQMNATQKYMQTLIEKQTGNYQK
jgi:hypothetical protein